ncbi:MAG: hypothetical protein ABJE95_19620 [Byssovorax sp.]
MNTKPFLISIGATRITGVLQLLDLAEASRYTNEATAKGSSYEAAGERLMMRRILSIEVDGDAAGALAKARAKLPQLATHITDLLTQAAGFPARAPAMKFSDELNAETPPLVLAEAGLTREAADRLLAEFDAPQRIVRITDDKRQTIFAAVVRTPDPQEGQILSSARELGKGIPAALLSLVRACTTFSRDELEGAIARYPAIPLLSLAEEWDALGGSGAEARFC